MLVMDPLVSRAVCWCLKMDSGYINCGNELTHGLGYADTRHRHLDFDQFVWLIGENKGTNRLILICKTNEYRRLRPHLPEPKFEEISGGFAFIRY